MGEGVLVEAEQAHGCGGVAAADDGEHGALGQGLGDGAGTAGEGVEFKDAHGAVPGHGLGGGELVGKELRGLGADVQAHLVVGDRVDLHDGRGRVSRELGGDDDVDGQHQVDATLGGLGDVTLDGVDLVFLEQGLAHRVALCGQEGEDHAAADEEHVGLLQQVGDDAQLVGDLGAAEDDAVGTLGVTGDLGQGLDLLEDEQAGGRGQQLGDVVDGRLLAVDDAEAVGDEGVAELGVLAGELFALLVNLGGLTGIETDVLEQGDLALTQGGDGLGGRRSNDVGGQRDLHAGKLSEALGDGGQREGGIDLTLGAAEVGHDDDLGTGVGEGLEGRQRRADTAVVGDDAVLERNVEVGADEDALAAQFAQGGDGPHEESFRSEGGGDVRDARARACTGISLISSWLVYQLCAQASLEPTRAVRRTRAFE